MKAQGPDAPGGTVDYAWPAEYGVSGVKTFIVNHRGVIYEKDMGANTAALAQQMPWFNPDRSWKPVEGE